MPETFNFSDGGAWVWTGDSTTSAELNFARNVSVTLASGRSGYRAPFSNQYTYIATGFIARVNMAAAYSDKNVIALFTGHAGGDFHMHVKHLTPNVNESGGFFLYTGLINQVTFNGTDGSPEQSLSFVAEFRAWLGY